MFVNSTFCNELQIKKLVFFMCFYNRKVDWSTSHLRVSLQSTIQIQTHACNFFTLLQDEYLMISTELAVLLKMIALWIRWNSLRDR